MRDTVRALVLASTSRVVCKREYVHARSALSKKNPDIWAFHSNNSKK